MGRNKYKELPDRMESKNLEPYFEEFMRENEATKDYNNMIDDLYELADRQWNSYELMEPQLLDRFDKWFQLKLNDNEFDYHYIEATIVIMCMLGLQKSFNELKSVKNKIRNEKVVAIIDHSLKYREVIVKDPFISMRDPNFHQHRDIDIKLDPAESLLFYQIKK